MIENRKQLEHTIQAVAKMYSLRDREAEDPLHSPELRADIVEGTEAMIRKLEREIAEYLATQYALPATRTEKPEVAA